MTKRLYNLDEVLTISTVKHFFDFMQSHGRVDLCNHDPYYSGIPSLVSDLCNMRSETRECRELDLIRLHLMEQLTLLYGE